jgi:tricorn protease-like protein
VGKSYLVSRSRELPSTALANHFELKQVNDKLCQISLDGRDTTTLLHGNYSGVVVSRDATKMMMKSPHSDKQLHVYDLSGGSCDTVIAQGTDSAGGVWCGIGHYEFDPAGNQIIYCESCDDGHYTISQNICLYDVLESKSYRLSPLVDSDGECSPSFAPNGRYFSFNAGGNAYIARLEVK